MSESQPADDAERIRLKRLAKLSFQPAPQPSPSTPSTSSTPPLPKAIPKPSPKRTYEQTAPPTPKRKAPILQERLDLDSWEDMMLGSVLKVTLSRSRAEETGYDLVWLKGLQLELETEDPVPQKLLRLRSEIADRLLIARLELDPNTLSDDLEFLPVLASLPPQQTVLEYLVCCWKRLNAARSSLMRKGYIHSDFDLALPRLDKLRDLIISYTGLTLQEPEMFPQPPGSLKLLGAPELLSALLSLTSLSSPLTGPSLSAGQVFIPSDLSDLFTDLAARFLNDGLEDIVAPIVRLLCFHPSLVRPEGLGGGDAAWRAVIAGLECLVGVKGIAAVITRMPEWCPANVSPGEIERTSLMGPLLRLGVFNREWPQVAATYFSDPLKRTRQDVDASNASLRGTLQSLQGSLFQIFNAIVRASPSSREGVLAYFAKAINLNVKRGGLRVDFDTVASDAFMINMHAVLLRFAEPFMDATYSKIDRIDPEFHRHSRRLDLSDETRLKATSDEVAKWVEETAKDNAPVPNFISEVFYLTAAINHYGLVRTIQEHDELGKELDQMQRHLDAINADTTWQGTPLQTRFDAQIQAVKNEMAKIHQSIFAYQVQLADPEFMSRNIAFTNFLSTWLIRLVDSNKTHPDPTIQLPLPQEIPTVFKMLPEYFVEDIVDYYLFLVSHQPQSLEMSGKSELVEFALTFLSSTWYITNPYLKSKLVQIIFYGTLPYGRSTTGVLGEILNFHPLALKQLMSCLMSFYIEVESTGTHTQFYDKFDTRRHIAHIWKTIWTNPTHRAALNQQSEDLNKFVRFVNLMMNDVTYLLDEALSKLAEIYGIQTEMEDREAWAAKPPQQRHERERLLHQLEGSATTYTALGKSTVALLKEFTAETKKPFMTPEIVDRLAAMLTFNLDALVGPRCQDLKVRNPEKYRFNPRELLSDILQVFLNLSDQDEFVRAVAGEGRSYKKALFERAAWIANNRTLKTEGEIEQLRLFAGRVEEMKVILEAEEDLGEIPDELLDPLMYTLMRDPVTLPSSRTVVDRSTIKAHLLSDNNDPFNRVPLKLEDILPNPEMKAKIDAFLLERRQRAVGVLEMPGEDVMQVDPDVQGSI